METDAAVLAQEAGNFERIAAELKTVMGQVEATAGALKANLDSPEAGVAAQAALTRYHEAQNQQTTLLDEISINIHQSGVEYTSTDSDQAANLQSTMANMDINH
ncbi:type VII secretion protein EsxB [Mycobacterium sp. GA-1999]|nr:type VII secretion protein EsxB [Mycobacterium sp. GA-1999]KUH91545.1 type VII secretion protein EsxB [Mycobacterium sp. GA-0227b]KUH96216.1 type VII secretion protein EsxB [Mycobacterium sp. IS-1556]